MLKKFLLSILCLLSISTNMYGMDASSSADASDIHVQDNNSESDDIAPFIRTQFQYNNTDKSFYDNRKVTIYQTEILNDPNKPFLHNTANVLVDGYWKFINHVPYLIGNLIFQAAAIKVANWWNGVPSEAPSAAERDLTNFTRQEMVEIARIQLLLQVNKETLTELKEEVKIFGDDAEQLKIIEEREQELRQNRKELTAQLHAMVKASAQVKQENKLVFSYPKAA